MASPLRLGGYGFALLGSAVVVYGAAVLYYLPQCPDLGLDCLMGTQIHRVNRGEESFEGEAPRVGDRLISVGGQRTASYADVLRIISSVDALPAHLVLAAHAPMPEDLAVPKFSRGGRDYVRIQFQRPGDPVPGVAPQSLVGWAERRPIPSDTYFLSLVWFGLQMGILGIGALVLWRRPEDPSAALFFLLCAISVGAYMGGYHWYVIAGNPILLSVFICGAMLLPVVSLHFYLVFPRPKSFMYGHPRRTLAAVYGLPVACLVAMLAMTWLVSGRFGTVSSAEQMAGLWGGIKALAIVHLVLGALYFVACMACLVHAFGACRSALERNQVKWILFGAVPASGCLVYVLWLAVTDLPRLALGGANWPMFFMSLLFTVAYAFSIIRYRLMHVGQIINRSVVYVAISAMAALTYYALVALGTLLVGTRPFGTRPEQILAVFLTVILLAVVFGHLRDRFQKALDRRFHRDRAQLDSAVRKMQASLGNVADVPTVASQLLETTLEALRVHNGALYVRSLEGTGLFHLVARKGGRYRAGPPLSQQNPVIQRCMAARIAVCVSKLTSPQDDPLIGQMTIWEATAAQPMVWNGQLQAVLLVGGKSAGHGLSPDELSFLDALSQVSALTIQGAQRYRTIERLNSDLQEKVRKIAEQQRRILLLQEQIQHEDLARDRTPETSFDFGRIIGNSPSVQEMLSLAQKVAVSNSAVLIWGESGSGKGLLAEAIHANSPRADKPFVTVHCAALSPGLLESELFGHVRGAFTGALRDKTGRFELADEGTLFLDEVGDISLETQTKLLRVLQDMAFEKVGSSETVHVDVRVIAATNQDLHALIRQGRFREDLFYRLNVISLRTPPLRERREDIFELAWYFLRQFSQAAGKPIASMDEDALEVIERYDWPGNVRQLENVIERAVVLAETDRLALKDLPAELQNWGAVGHRGAGVGDAASERGYAHATAELERGQLQEALIAAGGNKARAARSLGMARSTLFSKLKRLGLT